MFMSLTRHTLNPLAPRVLFVGQQRQEVAPYVSWVNAFHCHLDFFETLETALHSMKQLYPSVRILILEQEGTIEHAVEAMRAGAVDYLALPLPCEQFQSALKKLLDPRVSPESPLVYLDDVTGLYNSRFLTQVLDREIEKYGRERQSFAILFIDIDRFKLLNDTYGHLLGTRILKELSEHLRGLLRETDMLFRYGGDEFVAVLSPSDLSTAQAVADRIEAAVKLLEFFTCEPALEGAGIRITLSIGIALYPDHAQTRETILQMADQAMYGAKKSAVQKVFLSGAIREA